MKKALFSILFSLVELINAGAQESTVINDTTYFRKLYETGKACSMTKDSIIAAPVAAIPKRFADTLKKYDWLLLQNVDQYGHMNDFFAEEPRSFFYYNVIRYDTGVMEHLLTLQMNSTVKHDLLLNEGHFNGIAVHGDTNLLSMSVYNKNTWSGTDYRQFEWRRIVSYTKGVLIIDQLDYTQVWHPIISRSVFLKINRIPE